MEDRQIFDVFISGKEIDLVVLTEEIARKSQYYDWLNDEINMIFMKNNCFPNTKKMQARCFYSEIETSETKLQLGILHKGDQVLIVLCSKNNCDNVRSLYGVKGV